MAYNLLYLPIQQINVPVTNVAIGVLSRLQNEPEKFRRYFRTGLMLVLSSGMPLAGFMFVSADKIVPVVLGSQWIDVIPIFRILGVAGFFGSLNVATGWIFIAIGRTDRQFRWHLFASCFQAIAFAIGLYWGAVGVAAGFTISTVMLIFPAIGYCYRGTIMEMGDVLSTVWRPALAAVTAGVVTYGVGSNLDVSGHLMYGLIFDVGLYAAAYAAVWMILPGGWKWLRTVKGFARELRSPNE
jgi:O-antigen/teichoic acid export membrane protein